MRCIGAAMSVPRVRCYPEWTHSSLLPPLHSLRVAPGSSSFSEGGPIVPPTLDDVQVEQPAPGTAVAVFSGEHDLATRDEVTELLTSLVDANELVVADLSSAQFVDSSILRVLTNVNND